MPITSGDRDNLAAANLAQRPWKMVWALAIGQVISWGTLYYSFSALVVFMQKDLGWSRATLNGALSLGMLVAAFMAYPVGRRIDAGGGRRVMIGGCFLSALGLAAWGLASHPPGFYAAWVVVGVAMAASLYEPAFAIIQKTTPAHASRAITLVTLLGGLASTVFIPFTQFVAAGTSWRWALWVLASLHLAVCLPLYVCLIPRNGQPEGPAREPARESTAPASGDATLATALRTRAFWGLAIWFTAQSITFSGVTFQLIPFLTDQAVKTEHILLTAALIGPMQVLGRLVLMVLFSRQVGTPTVGKIISLTQAVALFMLLQAPKSLPWLLLFAVLYGTTNGATTILRGTAVAELLGRSHFGAIAGALTVPSSLARAFAPVVLAAIWSAADSETMLTAMVLNALVGLVGMLLTRPRQGVLARGTATGL